MNGPPEPGRNPHQFPAGRQRDQIQYRLYENINTIPGIENVRFDRSETAIDHQQVSGDVNTATFAGGVIDAEEASVHVNWWPQPDIDPYFQIHYHDHNGYDCGWHRHPNDHVDGDEHFQWRESRDDAYAYEEIEYDFDNPIGILWEVVGDRLEEWVSKQYGAHDHAADSDE